MIGGATLIPTLLLAGAPAPAAILHDVPCAGCVVVGDTRAPGPGVTGAALIVVLHGDEGSPKKVAALWGALAERGVCGAGASAHACAEAERGQGRSFVLAAPRCPRDAGCTAGSFWRWDGSPAWLFDQVDALARRVAIDPARVSLAGWSGGSTWIGMHGEAWFTPHRPGGLAFASVLIAAGGVPPAAGGACAAGAGGACAPVRYLMGDKNPYFDLAVETRDSLTACGHAVDWERLAGADHGGEWRAYERRVAELAAWLLDHPAGCAAPSPVTASSAAPRAPTATPLASASAPSPSASSDAAEPPDGAARIPPDTTGCACASAAERGGSLPLAVVGAVLAFVRRAVGRAVRARRASPSR